MENTDNLEQVDLENVDWESSREFFNSLRDELEKLDSRDESYNFTWVGKRKSIIEAGSPIEKTLRPDFDASKNFDETKNILIVGDNLDALKLLQSSYLGKIKMIYIDPPYNTGHDFLYHDNFMVKKSEYEDDSRDEDGNIIVSEDEFLENSKSNGRFHSDWLSMMHPRLKLARNLLSDDGVIFISIDDNEVHNLRKICDEIFGEENFLADILWNSTKSVTNTALISVGHTHNLTYFKNMEYFVKNRSEFRLPDDGEGFANPDNDPRGPWKADPFQVGGWRPNQQYEIINPKTGARYLPNPGCSWKNDFNKFKELVADNRIVFGKTGDGGPQRKRFKYEAEDRGKVPKTWWDDIETTANGTMLLKKIFDNISIFDNPKPVGLINRMLQLGASKDSLILDFFAGSGTTGHAVMDLNAEDGGNRKFILVQLDEPVSGSSEAHKSGYRTIDEITAERLRRAGEKIKSENPDRRLDLGFRVFRLDSTNEREDLRKPLKDIKQEDMFDAIDNIKKDRTPLDLLFGTILYMSLPLDLKLEKIIKNNHTIYKYGYLEENTGLIACFDDELDEEIIKEIAKMKPLTAVFQDKTFKDSAEKINLSEIFRTLSNDTKVKII